MLERHPKEMVWNLFPSCKLADCRSVDLSGFDFGFTDTHRPSTVPEQPHPIENAQHGGPAPRDQVPTPPPAYASALHPRQIVANPHPGESATPV